MLLQQGAAQHRLRRQPLAPGLLDPVPAQVRHDQTAELALIIEPRGHRLELTAVQAGVAAEGARLVRERLARAIAAGDGERYWPVIAEHIAAGGR